MGRPFPGCPSENTVLKRTIERLTAERDAALARAEAAEAGLTWACEQAAAHFEKLALNDLTGGIAPRPASEWRDYAEHLGERAAACGQPDLARLGEPDAAQEPPS